MSSNGRFPLHSITYQRIGLVSLNCSEKKLNHFVNVEIAKEEKKCIHTDGQYILETIPLVLFLVEIYNCFNF